MSRNRKDLTARLPDIAKTALEQLPPGLVVDGEVVIWDNGRLDFDCCNSAWSPASTESAA